MTSCGVRTFAAMIEKIVSLRRPAAKSLTNGSRSPSWKSSFAPSALLPGTMPPTSE